MKNRSLFWPLTMIAAGVIWLLVDMQIIPSANLWALTHVWPYVLIALGLGLILRSYSNFAGWIVSTLVVAGVVLAIVFAPQLGWTGAPVNWSFDPDFGGTVTGSGKIKTETRQLQDFAAISIQYPAEIVVKQGDAESVKVEADDNLLPQLSTVMTDGTLVIRNKQTDWAKRVNPSQVVKITITVKDLRNIDFKSAGRLTVEELKTDELILNLSGAGEVLMNKLDARRLETTLSGAGSIQADGTADELKLVISGMGSFDAPDLTSMKAEVRISGAGSATVRVKNELDAVVSGAGSINYYGSPSVTKNISGAGSVDQVGK